MDNTDFSGRYLGRLVEIKQSEEGIPYGLVVPLYQSAPERAVWATAVPKPKDALSDSGLILWWRIPEDTSIDTYWNCSVRPSSVYAPPDRREKYEVIDATPPVEAVDLWRKKWSEARIRELLTGEGVYLKSVPLGRQVMIWFAKDQWLGPVDIERSAKPGLWKIAEGSELTRLEVYRPPEHIKKPIDVAGHQRHLVQPSGDLGEFARLADWTPDHLVVSSLLRRIGELDRDAFEAIAVTDRILKQHQETLRAAGLIGVDLEQEFGPGERAEQLHDTLVRNGHLLRKAASIFQNFPEVRTQIEERTKSVYEEIRKEQSRIVEAELAQEQATLDKLREELSRSSTELASKQRELAETTEQIFGETAKLADIRRELAGKEDELEVATEAFRARLQERLRSFVKNPESLFDEYATIRAIIGSTESVRSDGADSATPSPVPIPVESFDSDAEVLADPKAAVTTLGRATRARGFAPQLGQHLLAAFVSGATPIVHGPRAFDALSAFASVATNQRLTWIPVSATMLEPRDLLGGIVPGTRTFLPHPGGLLDVLLEAERSEKLYLVVLEGFNRAPIESYLQPLLECRVDGLRGDTLRTIPVAPRGAVPASEPYAEVTRITWPPNVLLALLPTSGGTSFPIPPSLWRYSVLVDTGSTTYRTERRSTAAEASPSEIAETVWAMWREGVVSYDSASGPDALGGSETGYEWEPETLDLATNTLTAARTLGVAEQTSTTLAARMSLLPALVAAGADTSVLAPKLEIPESDIERVRSLLATDRR